AFSALGRYCRAVLSCRLERLPLLLLKIETKNGSRAFVKTAHPRFPKLVGYLLHPFLAHASSSTECFCFSSTSIIRRQARINSFEDASFFINRKHSERRNFAVSASSLCE